MDIALFFLSKKSILLLLLLLSALIDIASDRDILEPFCSVMPHQTAVLAVGMLFELYPLIFYLFVFPLIAVVSWRQLMLWITCWQG